MVRRWTLYGVVAVVLVPAALWLHGRFSDDWLAVVVMAVAGPGLVLLVPLLAVREIGFRARATRTTGTVFDADGIDTAGQAFTFTVRFTGMDGTLHTVRASGVRRREPGSQIGILYDPAAPDDARIADGNATVWLRALVMLAVGAVITYFLLRHG